MPEARGFNPGAIKAWIRGLPGVPGHTLRFALRVVTRFFGTNKGLLLAGAAAYNTLLSIIPLFALILIFFSVFQDQEELLTTIQAELVMVVPGQADAIGEVLDDFVAQIEFVGIIGLIVLLFFSSIAFRILENAMTVIFDMPTEKEKRSFWVSALIPYFFICILGVGVVAITAGTSLLDAIPSEAFVVPILGWAISIDAATSAAFYISGVVGLIIVFTCIYLVLPLQKIAWHRALVGGITATVLWEIVRHFLLWYFTQISLVNVVYGSLATVIIVLLSLEVAAVIVLLGAEVIADLERAARAGVPWYEGPTVHKDRGHDGADENGGNSEPKQRAGRTRVRTHRRLRRNGNGGDD